MARKKKTRPETQKVRAKKPPVKKKSARASKSPSPTTDSPVDVAESHATPALPGRRFPIVGIGASAGGLETLKQFFDAMPEGKSIAFVVVTHQHAGHISLLPELLSKHTRMEVCEAVDGVEVEPNRVYLAPSSGQLHLLGGKLHLLPTEPGLHLPIDSFFRSLAIDQKSNAIGIVLSGTGSDGTLGIKAIKGEAGMVMAQDPASARYDGMPRSAVATGIVDYVLPVEEMPKQLLGYATGPYMTHAGATSTAVSPGLIDAMTKIFVLLRNRTRHDFSHYKSNTVRRRIERRMSVHQIRHAKDYVRFLHETPHELDVLFRELLIGVTRFFRDAEAFKSLSTDILPGLLADKPEGYVFRIWSAGCSSGEEAYSLAMVVREAIDRVNPQVRLQVFATDLDSHAIDVARRGVYPDGVAADIEERRLQRFFTRDDGNYRIHKDLRELVVFAPQDIISDPPFTKLDILACRNVLIYMDGELQKKLFPVFHYALKPGGLLFLGNSESIGNFSNLFRVVDKKWKLYLRNAEARSVLLLPPRDTLEFRRNHPSTEMHVSKQPSEEPLGRDLLHLLERRLLCSYTPPTVIVSERGEIVYIHGRTGSFLEPAPGEASNNIMTMARQGLQPTLSTLVRRAVSEGAEVIQRGVRVLNNGNSIVADIVVRPINEPEMIRGLLMVSFEEVRPGEQLEKQKIPKKKSRGRAAELEEQLQHTKESLQSTIEELETTNEELKSSNEELQSTNEELQSTNEELETSKEEMQSLNEELQTVNSELQMKNEDLALVNDDMTNLLNNTNIATVFLDNDLNINRFTESLSDVIKIIPTDVGRPIGDLVSCLDYDLVNDARDVIATLMTRETEARSVDDRWYNVRLMPYRTSDNVINGLVATFVDVTNNKKAELQVAAAAQYAQSIVDSVREPLLVLNEDLIVVSANKAFFDMFQVKSNELIGRLIYDLGNGQWNVPLLREQLETILPRNTCFENVRVECDIPTLGKRIMMLNGRRLDQAITLPGKILLAFEDATDGDS